jgi:hypothetical protein
MLIKDLSSSVDLDSAAMTAVCGGQADPEPGPIIINPQDFNPFGPPSVNPQTKTAPNYNYHEYYHPYTVLKR